MTALQITALAKQPKDDGNVTEQPLSPSNWQAKPGDLSQRAARSPITVTEKNQSPSSLQAKPGDLSQRLARVSLRSSQIMFGDLSQGTAWLSLRSSQTLDSAQHLAKCSRRGSRADRISSLSANCVVSLTLIDEVLPVSKSWFQSMAAGILRVSVPVAIGVKAVGAQYAARNSDEEIPTIAPLLCASLFSSSLWLILLLVLGGISEVKKLLDWRYMFGAAPALFSSGRLCCESRFIKLGGSPTMLVVGMKLFFVPGLLGEIALTRIIPYKTQLFTVSALVLVILSYACKDGGLSISTECLLLGLSAAMCRAADSLSFDLIAHFGMGDAREDKNTCGKIMVLLVNEVYKAIFFIGLLLVWEFDMLKNDLLSGFNVYTTFSIICPGILAAGIYNLSMIENGMLRTVVASSLDVATTLILEVLAFGEHVKIIDVMMLGAIISIVFIHIQFSIDLRIRAALAVLEGNMDANPPIEEWSANKSSASAPTNGTIPAELRGTIPAEPRATCLGGGDDQLAHRDSMHPRIVLPIAFSDSNLSERHDVIEE